MPTFLAPVAVGAAPASVGGVRLTHAQRVVWRNSGDTADEAVMEFNSGISYYDNLTSGGYHEFRQGASYTMLLRMSGGLAAFGTQVRLPNAAPLVGRNAGNSADYALVTLGASNTMVVGDTGNAGVLVRGNGVDICTFNSTGIVLNDTRSLQFGTTTGGRVGVLTTEKIGFWGATPVVQPANTVAIDTLLAATGLRASGGTANFATPISTAGITGATAVSRLVGATTSGAPASGTFAVGDTVIDRTGKIWINTTAGAPGTFTQVGGSATTSYWSDAKWGVD